MPSKETLLFSTSLFNIFKASKAAKEVALADEMSRVVMRVVKSSVILSSVGKGLFISYGIPAEVTEEKVLLLDSKELSMIFSGIRMNDELQANETVSFYYLPRRGGNRLVVKAFSIYKDGTKILHTKVLSLRSLDMTPSIPRMPKEGRISVKSDILISALNAVYRSSNSSSNNPAFCGCKVSYDSHSILTAATDGICFSECKEEVSGGGDSFTCMLPYKYCTKFSKIVSPEEITEIVLSKGLFFTRTPTSIFGTATIRAEFPDYSSILCDKDIKVTVPKKILSDCLNALLPVSSRDAYNKVTLGFSKNTNQMSLYSCGFSTSGLPVVIEAPEKFKEMSVDFNMSLLIKVLAAIKEDMLTEDGDFVCFEISDSGSPVFVKPAGGTKSFSVVAPLSGGS